MRFCLIPFLHYEADGNLVTCYEGDAALDVMPFMYAFLWASESKCALSNMHLNAMFKEVLMLQDWLGAFFYEWASDGAQWE